MDMFPPGGAAAPGMPQPPEPGPFASQPDTSEQEVLQLEDLLAEVRAQYEDAKNWTENTLAPERDKATRYYNGEPFGDEQEGRSSVVATEVRDVVRAIMPSLLRVFTSSQAAVECAARGPEDQEQAEQATDYLKLVIEQGGGFRALHDAMKDALIRKVGFLKWWWDRTIKTEAATYRGLLPEQFQALATREGTTVVEHNERPPTYDERTAIAKIAPQVAASPTFRLVDATLRVTSRQARARIAALPPEEVLFARDARTLAESPYVAHRRILKASDLVAMGFDKQTIDDLPAFSEAGVSTETQTRNRSLKQAVRSSGRAKDPSQKRVLYVEHYIWADLDGDGIAELMKVCTAGDNHEPLAVVTADHINIAEMCPDPEAHQVIGQSIADATMDLQFIKSHIMRAMLDSLAQSVFPQRGYVDGAVNVDDLMNNEAGALVRMRAPGMVQEFTREFNGQGVLGVMAYLDAVREQRTGISRASQGLEAQHLQSTTAAAVAATMAGAQDRLDMIARIFAEGGIKCLHEGILHLLAVNQDRATVVQLRGKWTPVEPSCWRDRFDVAVSASLSRGTQEQRLMFLGMVAQKQEQTMQMAGPNNPVANVGQYTQTLTEMCRVAGYPDPGRFITNLPRDFKMPTPPPKPTPEELLAQVEKMKAEASVHQTEINAGQKAAEAAAADDLARDSARADAILKAIDLTGKYSIPIDITAIAALFAPPALPITPSSTPTPAMLPPEAFAQEAPQMPPGLMSAGAGPPPPPDPMAAPPDMPPGPPV